MKMAGFAENAIMKFWEKGQQHRLPHGELVQEAAVKHQVQHEATKSDKENTVQTINSTSTRTGRPKVAYAEASEGTERRIEPEAKSDVNELFRKCKDMSQGCGQHVLSEITDKGKYKIKIAKKPKWTEC